MEALSIYSKLAVLAAVAALGLEGCRDQRLPTDDARGRPVAANVPSSEQSSRYIVTFVAEQVPADFAQRVAELGGTVDATLDSIGVATVTGLTSGAATQLAATPGVQAVEPDRVRTSEPTGLDAADASTEPPASATLAPADAAASPTAAQFYARQWNMRAIFADQAWAAGQLGSDDVVVAILDSGIDYTLPDLAGLVDLERSTSFTPDEDPVVAQLYPGRLPISDLHSHGTTVASVIASKGTVLAGINQHATLVAVKIANRFFEVSVAQWLRGLVYAADHGADVINLSDRMIFDKHTDHGVVAAFNRAAKYVFRKGAVFVASAGNDVADLDHNRDQVVLPCEAPHVICVAATGPTSTAGVNGPWVDVDAFVAGYSNYGRSAVDVAAPGGAGIKGIPDPDLSGTRNRRVWALCTTTPTEVSFPACRNHQPITQPFGTTYSAAHVSGLAALLVAQLGHGNPALIRARILQSADDLGEPGTDPYYGKGRINIARALGVVP